MVSNIFALSEELKKFSDKIYLLQNGLKHGFSVPKILIGGSSARTLLDHFYLGKPLKMRDIDIFISINQPCHPEFAEKIGRAFNGTALGVYSANDLRPRPRARAGDLSYNAGYGFFWISHDNEIIDLSIFHSEVDIALNGIFDIDKIRIPLNYPETLENIINKYFYKFTLTDLIENYIIEDSYHGYYNWLRNKMKIVEWSALRGDPLVMAIRVVKSYALLNYQYLPNSVIKWLKILINNACNLSQLQFKRNMHKVLTGDRIGWIVNSLTELGVFDAYKRVSS